MEKRVYETLHEELFYEKMDNGLDVYILPKKGFNKTYATFTTNYGSVDNQFVPLGKTEMKRVPDGIAHFLEHKLFEKEDGDVFQQFSKQGASANAFTTFTRTAYLFSSTDNVEKNLETLIDFVQTPYFSDKTVEKEKGIIGQEIRMYDDNPDWRVYFGAIESMYHNHPVKIDIAGTVESIAQITKELLYECYETFYHPSNMLLFVVGPVDEQKMMQQIRDNQAKKSFPQAPEVKRFAYEEPSVVAEKKKVIPMHVQTNKCFVGIKAPSVPEAGEQKLRHELAFHVALDYLFGKSSPHYERLYREGLIDDTFMYDYTEERGFGFALIGGDTRDAERLASEIQTVLLSFSSEAVKKEEFERVKKKKIGAFLRALNSPEYIANQFTRYAFYGSNLFDILPALSSLAMDDIAAVASSCFRDSQIAVCEVVPKGQ
ncbi:MULTISPECIES: EF-P 5-aminopentanol modification-associated protein YfmH [Geobacillus]|uniref:Peptidase M16 n=1 Tax=Geobacillus thermocatenulatus TaxID=33938 RepID=A0A226Q3K9_9BACL|nr:MULTISPECIES: pitrilysin family protein [Geobacillus]ASS99879.1 peptidase M16 [Geobacillus thermocatenulatus]KLR72657.1 zinc protease [Geobacillus sp. T6]OXB86260.1 peptidase M16 [Geobacillus thermocatenulatus]RAN23360.1 zinc protease [Geobacillus sp. A8]